MSGRSARASQRQFCAKEKIRLVLSGLRGEDSIVELCRREGIVQNLYYRWLKEFLEAGKKRLVGDTARAASSDEVKKMRWEASAAEEVVAPASPGATTLAISSPSPVSRGGLGLFAASER